MIADRAEVLTFLGKGSSLTDAEDGFLNMIQPMVELDVQRLLGYSVVQATYTHFLPHRSRGVQPVGAMGFDVRGGKAVIDQPAGGREDSQLLLPELPVRSVTSVNEDTGAYGGQGSGDFAAASLLTAGSDYWIDQTEDGISTSAILRRIGGAWPSSARSVKVVYVAGYTQAELATGIAAPIKMAVWESIRFQFANRGAGAGAVKSEKLGDYSVTYAAADGKESSIPRAARKRLRPFLSYGRFM